MTSPLIIEIMFECYCSGKPGANIMSRIWHSPAAEDARNYLIDNGLIYENLTATQRGAEWVSAICSVRL